MARPRVYDNSAREQAARETRARIVAAARALLLEGGHQAMTVAGLASTAGVSPQTVYNAIGGKAEVVKAVYDVMLAGDDEPVPMSERPAFLAMAQSPDRASFLAAYAGWSRALYERVGPLLGVLLAKGAGGDGTLAGFVATIERERRTGNGHMVAALEAAHGLPAALTADRAVDIVWTLTAPEVADRLIRRCGWSPDAYEQWLSVALQASLT